MRKLIVVILVTLSACIILFTFIGISFTQIRESDFPLEQKWIFEADGQFRSSPVVSDGKIFVRTNLELYAINGSTGDLIWRISLPKDWHSASPIVQDEIVVVSHSEGTSAFNVVSGELLWQVFDTGTRSDARPTASNEQVVIVIDTSILVRDIKTGELIWEIENPYHRSDALAFLNDKYLHVVFADQIHSYDIETGELISNLPTEEWSLQNGVFDNDIMYLEQLGEGISAYDLKNQKTLWRRSNIFLTDYPPTIHENILFVGSRGTVPIAVNALTGETLWESREISGYDNYQTPLIFDASVYVRGLFQKKVYALDKDTGGLIGHISLGMPNIISANADYSLGPIQFDESIIFIADNKLMAYGR